MRMMIRRGAFWLVATALLVLAAAPMTAAKNGDVEVRGTCSKASSSKLKLSLEDAGIEVELEVDQNRNGVRWSVVLRRLVAGRAPVVARGTRITTAPSGSFEFRRVLANRLGKDRIRAVATRSGEVCRATATI